MVPLGLICQRSTLYLQLSPLSVRLICVSPPAVSTVGIPFFDPPNPRRLGPREFQMHMDSKLKGAAYPASRGGGMRAARGLTINQERATTNEELA
jgi:hypothetical protein